MQLKRKKVLFHSNYCDAPTGFGGFMKEILTYLYKTNKYDLYLYASGVTWENADFERWPWKVYGAFPNNPQEINEIMKDPGQARLVSYGHYNIDKVIQTVKPDVYIGVEDFWGVEYAIDKIWFDKINSVIVWTADSLPLLQNAVDKAPKIKNHYVWADFARKEFHKLGITNVGTLRGSVDTDTYRKIPDYKKNELRQKFNIPLDCFCIGTLSRNQLRKLYPNLIEGYKIFKIQNPEIKNTRLLFFTHFTEGWDIPRLIKDNEVDPKEVLCCYKCRKTGEFFVMPFEGQDIDNPVTGDKKTLITVNVQDKLTNEQVNEWYNLLDVFCLPITSGGQERAVQEAKLCELITLINPYSCGEDNCTPEAYSLPLEFSTYREIGTQFIKASVYPSSIAKQLKRVYEMSSDKRREYGKNARKWTMDNFSIEVVGKRYENVIDNLPDHNWDFNFEIKPKNPDAEIPVIEDNGQWLIYLYDKILNMTLDSQDPGHAHWMNCLQNNMPRDKILEYFRRVAKEENLKNSVPQGIQLQDLLIKNDKKHFLIVAPESCGDVLYVSSLCKSFRKSYPSDEWNLYLACKQEYHEIFDGNQFLDKVIPFHDTMNNEMVMTGAGNHKGVFDGYCFIPVLTQRFLSYLTHHNISLQLTNK